MYPAPTDQYGRSSKRSRQRPSNQPRRSRRSWTDSNGNHHTVETTSYVSPGGAFSFSGGSFSTGMPDQRQLRAPLGGLATGLLSTAVGLLGAIGDARQASQAPSRQSSKAKGPRLTVVAVEEQDSEDDLAYGDSNVRQTQPRSVFTRLKDRLAEAQPVPRSSRRSDRPHLRRSQASHESSRRSSRYAYVDEDGYDDDYEDEHYYQRSGRPSALLSDREKRSVINALVNAVNVHKAEVKSARKRLERAARQDNVDIRRLQQLLADLESQQEQLADARENLEAQMEELYPDGMSPPQNAQRATYSQPTSPLGRSTEDELNDFFASTSLGGMPGQQRTRQATFPSPFGFGDDPMMRMLNEHFFNDFHNQSHVFNYPFFNQQHSFHLNFGMPFTNQQTRQTYSAQNPRPQPQHSRSQPPPTFPTFTQSARPQQHPPNVLTPEEAKKLYATYKSRWESLSPSDSDFPYPSTTLKHSRLTDRLSIWAPSIQSRVRDWSEDAVRQANVQAFFLNVVGLLPQYTEGAGKIEMGFDKSRASAQQVNDLINVLKKEKFRWHPDRLALRGQDVNFEPNRAVFHAVCELMDAAKSFA